MGLVTKYTIILALLFAVTRVNIHHIYSNYVGPVIQEILDTEDPYAILDVNYTMSVDEIHKVWKKLAVQYHPDKNRDDPNASEKFADLNRAWNQIKKPEDKEWYDTYAMILVPLKKMKKGIRCFNVPVILVAKLLGLPDVEENFMQFDGLQYGYGFLLAMIAQIIFNMMWQFLVAIFIKYTPTFIQRLISFIWSIVTLPYRICCKLMSVTFSLIQPLIQALGMLYCAMLLWPSKEFTGNGYLGRLALYVVFHSLYFVRVPGSKWIRYSQFVFVGMQLYASESAASGSAENFESRLDLSNLFHTATLTDVMNLNHWDVLNEAVKPVNATIMNGTKLQFSWMITKKNQIQ